MGVEGLLQYCNYPTIRRKVVEKVDLVEEANQKGGITLLVDLSSFQYIIDSKLQEVLGDNKFLAILGGEYSTLHGYVKQLIEKLRSKDIYLVFYADGSKASNSREAVQTFGTQTERCNQRRENADNVINVCTGLKTIDDLRKSRPALRVIQLFRTIEECGCDIKISAEGSVDRDIAKDFIKEQSYAILSLDTDFCIFKDCCLITDKMFDLENDLRLKEPKKVMSELLKAEKVMTALGIDDHDQMVELSIVAGNDFTRPFMRDLRTGVDLSNFQSIIEWVKRYRKVENNWEMHKAMKENPDFKEAVESARNFYKNKPESAMATSPLPPKVMDIKNKIYWHQIIVEDNEFACLSGENALQYLRAHIYRLVLPQNERIVKEYDANSNVNMEDFHVESNKQDPKLSERTTLMIFVKNSIVILNQQLQRLSSTHVGSPRKSSDPYPLISREEFQSLYFPAVNYKFKLCCKHSNGENDDKVHQCTKKDLAVKEDDSSIWTRIRPWLGKPVKEKCRNFPRCRYDDDCNYPHCEEELKLWKQKCPTQQFIETLKTKNIKSWTDMENIKNIFNIYEMLLTTNETVGRILTLHVTGNTQDIDKFGTAVSQITCNAEHLVDHVCKLRGKVFYGRPLPVSVKELISALTTLFEAILSEQEHKKLTNVVKDVWAACDWIFSEFQTRKEDKKHYWESKNWKQIHFDLLVRRVSRQFVDMRAATLELVHFSKETDKISIWQQFQRDACMLEALIGQYGRVPSSLHKDLDSMNTAITEFCTSTDQITSAEEIQRLADRLSATITEPNDSICKMISQVLKNVTENKIASLRQKVWAQRTVFHAELAQKHYVAEQYDNAKRFEKDCLMLAILLVIKDGAKLQKSKSLLCVDIHKFVEHMKSGSAPDMPREELLEEGNGISDGEDRIVRKIKNMQDTYRRKIIKIVANSKGYLSRKSQMTSANKKLFISLEERSISLREHYIEGKSENSKNGNGNEKEIAQHLLRVDRHMADVESLFNDTDGPRIDAVKDVLVEICSGIKTLKATVQKVSSAELTEAYNALVGAVIDLLSAVQPWSNPVLAVNDPNLPAKDQINEDDLSRNWKHFHYIISYFEPENFRNGTSWFTDRRSESGKDTFKLYILRYFLRLNWERNLHVTKGEFEALMALVFGKTELKEEDYQAICLRPTTRCLTLGSWFQNVYKHLFNYLGYLLYLVQDFPQPREVFCGSVWTVFFTCNQDESVYENEYKDVKKKLDDEKKTIRNILEQKRQLVHKVIEDIY